MCHNNSAPEKVYVSGTELVGDSFELAYRVLNSGFVPEFLIVLWRGGTPIGVGVHEYFEYKGIRTAHYVVKASSYSAIGVGGSPVIEHADSVIGRIPDGAAVLVVDDIFDSGRTVRAMCELLRVRTANVRIATLFWKPSGNVTSLRPDYYVHATEQWVVFPHELVGLSDDELRFKGERVRDIVKRPLAL